MTPQGAKRYQQLAKSMTNISSQFLPKIVNIGKLQLLRKLVVRQINFAAKIECSQYTSCLETVNQSLLSNITEIKENALKLYLERDCPEIIMAEQAMN